MQRDEKINALTPEGENPLAPRPKEVAVQRTARVQVLKMKIPYLAQSPLASQSFHIKRCQPQMKFEGMIEFLPRSNYGPFKILIFFQLVNTIEQDPR